MEQIYFKLLIVLLAFEFAYKGDSVPLPKYQPTKVQRMYNGLYVAKAILRGTFPEPILREDEIEDGDNAFEIAAKKDDKKTKLKSVLSSLKETIDMLTTINNLITEGSGETSTNELSKELMVTQSVLTKSMNDACEWMKVGLEIKDDFDCSNGEDIYRIVVRASAYLTVTKAHESVLELEEKKTITVGSDTSVDRDILTTPCQWFFCNYNPECGNDFSKTTYDFMFDNLYCHNLINMKCSLCTNE